MHLLPIAAERPQPLPPGFVEGLRARPGVPAIVAHVAAFAENAIVRILAGAFAGRSGRVMSSSQKATRLSLQGFAGRDMLVTVATDQLGAVG